MKNLILTLALGPLFAFAVGARACPALSGKYVDDRGFEDFVKVSGDCKEVTWTVNYVTPPTSPDPKFPSTHVLYVDGTERMSELLINGTYVFSKGTTTDKSVVIDERTENVDGYVVDKTRTNYYMKYSDVSQLIEEHVTVNEDGSTSPWYTRAYNKVH